VFAAALQQISEDIKTLVHQKVALGLLPPDALRRLPKGEFRKIVPVLAVADPNDLSACWDLLGQVIARCRDAQAIVAEIRDYDDPAPVIRMGC